MRLPSRFFVCGLMLLQCIAAHAQSEVGQIFERVLRDQLGNILTGNGQTRGKPGSSASSVASAQYGDVVFSDDFSGSIDPKKWRVQDGDWLTADGCLYPDGLQKDAQARISPQVTIGPGYVVYAEICVPEACYRDALTIQLVPEKSSEATYGFVAEHRKMYWMRWKSNNSSPVGETNMGNYYETRVHKVVLRIEKNQSSYSINGAKEVPCSFGISAKGSLSIRVGTTEERDNSSSIKLDRLVVYKPKSGSVAQYACDQCEANFESQDELDQHIQDVHRVVQSGGLPIGSKEATELAAELRQQMASDQSAKTGRIGIATFDMIGISDQTAAKQFAECLYTAMFKEGFKLVDRGKIDKIMTELKIQQSGLTDPETIKKIGKQANCDFILLGSISASRKKIIINARLDKTETGEVVSVGDVEIELPVKDK